MQRRDDRTGAAALERACVGDHRIGRMIAAGFAGRARAEWQPPDDVPEPTEPPEPSPVPEQPPDEPPGFPDPAPEQPPPEPPGLGTRAA